METKAVLSLLEDSTFKNYARTQLVNECIKIRLPAGVSLQPFDDVLEGKTVPDMLLKSLYKKLMHHKGIYDRTRSC